MRKCMWFYEPTKECGIDCPDSVYPCPAKGDLDNCIHVDLNGKPLKDNDFYEKKD